MTQVRKLLPELFEEPTRHFKNYLELTGNDLILFSGAYGLGKTSFIEHFFSKEGQKKLYGRTKFISVHLKPVNYSVATNEDIFRYLKFDLIIELLFNKDNQVTLSDKKVERLASLATFVSDNITEFLFPLLKMLPLVGKDYYNILEKYKGLYDQFKKFEADFKTEQQHIKDFITLLRQKEGSIYEGNVYTELIVKMLEQLKEDADEEVETILIVDDLDRIDPHHIFRLFNVFAAHFENKVEKGNKFGFDKVIFICDVNNIENIFRHNYGIEVDFNGYIDKFFSRHIHFFDNRKAVERIINDVIKGFVFEGLAELSLAQSHQGRSGVTDIVKYCLRELVLQGKINLRALIRLSNEDIKIPIKELHLTKFTVKHNYNFTIVLVIDCLYRIFGDYFDLSNALKRCEVPKATLRDSEDFNFMLGHVAVLVGYKSHNFSPGKDYLLLFDVMPNKQFELMARLEKEGRNEIYWSSTVKLSPKGNFKSDSPPFFFFLAKAVDALKEIGYLHI